MRSELSCGGAHTDTRRESPRARPPTRVYEFDLTWRDDGSTPRAPLTSLSLLLSLAGGAMMIPWDGTGPAAARAQGDAAAAVRQAADADRERRLGLPRAVPRDDPLRLAQRLRRGWRDGARVLPPVRHRVQRHGGLRRRRRRRAPRPGRRARRRRLVRGLDLDAQGIPRRHTHTRARRVRKYCASLAVTPASHHRRAAAIDRDQPVRVEFNRSLHRDGCCASSTPSSPPRGPTATRRSRS